MQIASSSETSNFDGRKIDYSDSVDYKPPEKRARSDSTDESQFFSKNSPVKEEYRLPYIKKIRDGNNPPFVAHTKREYRPSPYAAPALERLPPIRLPTPKKLYLHDRPERNDNRSEYKEGRPFQPIILFSNGVDITQEEPSRYRYLVERNIEKLEERSKLWESARSKFSKPISDKSPPVLSPGFLPTLLNDSKVLPPVRHLIESSTQSTPSHKHESKTISSPKDTYESNALSRSRYLDINSMVSQEAPIEYRSEAYTNQSKPSFSREGPERTSSILLNPTDEAFSPVEYARPIFMRNLPPQARVSLQSTKRKRGNLPKEVTAILDSWFFQHVKNPYPVDEEKLNLIKRTGLTRTQVDNWFINARRRKLKKDHVWDLA